MKIMLAKICLLLVLANVSVAMTAVNSDLSGTGKRQGQNDSTFERITEKTLPLKEEKKLDSIIARNKKTDDGTVFNQYKQSSVKSGTVFNK